MVRQQARLSVSDFASPSSLWRCAATSDEVFAAVRAFEEVKATESTQVAIGASSPMAIPYPREDLPPVSWPWGAQEVKRK